MKSPSHSALLSDTINIAQITNSTKLKGSIYHFESVDSTSTWLQQHGKCGDVCISDMQTSGRGRRGNKWVSPQSGNIYFSMSWCFEDSLLKIKHQSLLGLVVGIAVADALKELGLKNHGVKWPNDIFWQRRKMGGILIESVSQSGNFIIGIGLNVNMLQSDTLKIDQHVCSLSDAFDSQRDMKHVHNEHISRNQLIIYMIQQLSKQLSSFSDLNFESFQETWQKWDILNNKQVSFTHQTEVITGRVSGLDIHGRLGILNEQGNLKYYSSADIKLRKPA